MISIIACARFSLASAAVITATTAISTQFVKAYREGFAYSGEYSKFRRRRHGSSSRDLGADRFVVFAQNHDQVGNRMRGDRLSAAVSFEDLKLAAGIVLLSPYLPLLFMGEEYGESAPFPYFISHSDARLSKRCGAAVKANSLRSIGKARFPIRKAKRLFFPPSSIMSCVRAALTRFSGHFIKS